MEKRPPRRNTLTKERQTALILAGLAALRRRIHLLQDDRIRRARSDRITHTQTTQDTADRIAGFHSRQRKRMQHCLFQLRHDTPQRLFPFPQVPLFRTDAPPQRTKAQRIATNRIIEDTRTESALDRAAGDVGATVRKRCLTDNIVKALTPPLRRHERGSRRPPQGDGAQCGLLQPLPQQPFAQTLLTERTALNGESKVIHQPVLCEERDPL